MNETRDIPATGSRTADPPQAASETEPPLEREPGSFRDRNGRVFYRDGRVFRTLSPRALADWQRLRATSFFQKGQAQGDIVETWMAEEDTVLPEAVGVLEHARIPFVSYPYEWTFGMLKDAALLHLELMRDALTEDMILQDSSPYNVQWTGVHPAFIDIPSFRVLERGQSWVGYRQFCELFLYPLMLQAYKGIDARPWLRGRIDGIAADDMRRLMSARDMVRPGVLLHVLAQSALQRRYSASGRNVRGALVEAGFDKALIANNVDKLAALVAKLSPGRNRTEWSNYDREHSYDHADFGRKVEFVRTAAATRRWRLAWDLGCNTGTFSHLIEPHADYVVAMDGDAMAIEHFYQRERAGRGSRSILPLVVNLADASPNQGWLGAERKGLVERGRPELTLCLALIHHVVITANIPLAEFIGWLAELGTTTVIEFVGRDDEMVQKLLANREDQYQDYNAETFRTVLASCFELIAEQPLKDGKRHIYFAQSKCNGR